MPRQRRDEISIPSAEAMACIFTAALLSHRLPCRSTPIRRVSGLQAVAASDELAVGTFTGPPGGGFEVLDVEAMRAESTFPIAPDDLIFRCQEVLAANVGTKDPSMLADE